MVKAHSYSTLCWEHDFHEPGALHPKFSLLIFIGRKMRAVELAALITLGLIHISGSKIVSQKPSPIDAVVFAPHTQRSAGHQVVRVQTGNDFFDFSIMFSKVRKSSTSF